ncbi:MAG TPA: transaldolase family protein [Bacteroidales bacterium]|nr:transaldolase family protein [Bacteroidales bacterium]
MADLSTRISDFLWKDLLEKHANGKHDPFWEALRSAGSELWLDTGDMAEAEANWSSEMSALTTNNTLLNTEIQKGIYDVFISESKAIVRELPQEDRVKEIAFILNARHGLRLAQKFRGFVSVELHTDTAHDIKAIFSYGKRYHDICPEQFIVKVPLTAEGLIGARMLKEAGVRVNFTLGFSARQNVLITRVAKPDYVNVFLGRIGAFIADNNLGDGSGAGEKAVIASQNWVTALSSENQWQTKQIAASLRNHKQIELLSGVDVFTIPPKVAAAAHKDLSGKFVSHTHENYEANLNENAAGAHIEKFWEVNDKVQKLSARLDQKMPASASELIHIAHDEGCEDMFPYLTKEEKGFLTSDGKIPVYSRWSKRIAEGNISPDTLLTLAGLASFTSDQQALDERIRGIIEV